MRLIQPTAGQWAKQRVQEAAERGYRVVFAYAHGEVTASFFNGEFFCYSRTFRSV